MTLDMSSDMKELKVSSHDTINILGDVDMLLRMNLHKVSRRFFEQNTDNAIKKYIPEDFISSL